MLFCILSYFWGGGNGFLGYFQFSWRAARSETEVPENVRASSSGVMPPSIESMKGWAVPTKEGMSENVPVNAPHQDMDESEPPAFPGVIFPAKSAAPQIEARFVVALLASLGPKPEKVEWKIPSVFVELARLTLSKRLSGIVAAGEYWA